MFCVIIRLILCPKRKKYRLYSPTALTNAYKMVKEHKMSVKNASRMFHVPDTTLRDRVLQKLLIWTKVTQVSDVAHGPLVIRSPVLECFEEANLVRHFKTMAAYGYGYTRQESVDIASDYAVHLGKRTMDKPFTMKWMRGFLKRWPKLKVLKPRGLEHVRAKMTSKETVAEYFKNLANTISTYNMHDKPHLIYNIDEKGIFIDHKPPSVVSDSTYCPQAVTSGRGKTITILGGGSAKNHFLKFVPRRNNEKVLLLLDGHRSHVSVNLVKWAKQQGIIIFILPGQNPP
ncbi:uncharacterized protein LOC130053792 [Ostrea edulis]|uniref:uncharacterized protein LOC130053792 n=1 Tax=Ostrea edulis TaxID=37623 RepID=UPI0024AF3A43|nr:uncharacterized protein LOC130053792 [Ostrea edulis]